MAVTTCEDAVTGLELHAESEETFPTEIGALVHADSRAADTAFRERLLAEHPRDTTRHRRERYP